MTHASLHPPRLLKSWGDEAVVFDASSCNTHYLKPLALMLYQTCRDHPGYTSTDLGVADSPRIHDLTAETLTNLRKVGLLESA